MAAIARTYTRLVHDKTGWWGTFPLDLPIQVGDIVSIDKEGVMMKISSALDRPGWRGALPIDTTPTTGDTSYSWGAKKSVGGSAAASATATPGVNAKASVGVSFSEEGSFLIEYTAAEHAKFRDVEKARKWVLAAAKSGEWPPRHCLITEAIRADPAAVLVSSKKNSRVNLGVGARLAEDVSKLNLGDAKLEVSVSAWEGSGAASVSKNAAPLYHCAVVSRDWLRRYHANLQAGVADNLDEAVLDDPFEASSEDQDV